jgi:hypothetical protein
MIKPINVIELMPNIMLAAPALLVSIRVSLSLLYASYCLYPAVDTLAAPVSIKTL